MLVKPEQMPLCCWCRLQQPKAALAQNPELVKQVGSVVGIGKRATAILIVTTQGFKHTENYRQLISYAGLSPKEYSSGSSIRGKVRICKQGGSLLRHTLYMCALNAKETNGACKELFDRLVSKGKNKKLAIIAVANKLLKQVFGVVKNETLFNRNYYKKVAWFICFYAQFMLVAGVSFFKKFLF